MHDSSLFNLCEWFIPFYNDMFDTYRIYLTSQDEVVVDCLCQLCIVLCVSGVNWFNLVRKRDCSLHASRRQIDLSDQIWKGNVIIKNMKPLTSSAYRFLWNNRLEIYRVLNCEIFIWCNHIFLQSTTNSNQMSAGYFIILFSYQSFFSRLFILYNEKTLQ